MDLNANLASLLTLIAAVTTALVSVIAAWRSSARAEIVKNKLEEIHTSTNGNLSKMQAKLDALEITAKASEARAVSMQDIVTSLTKNTVVVPTVVTPGIPIIDKNNKKS